MTVHTALLQGTRLLEDAHVAVPRLTAEVLLSHALHRERPYLFAHPEQELREVEWLHYGRYLHERMGGKPTQYITHRAEFYGREFRVTPEVLIPRPETEHVVELALALARGDISFRAQRILDVGAGSGALAVTLQLETGVETWATEISPVAAAVARYNARRLESEIGIVVATLWLASRRIRWI
jgi:release factor glutamine methyltransferase